MPIESQVVQLPPVPLMHWRRFAEMVGLEEGVVRGLCDKGYLPVVNQGKYRFINLALLTQRCLEADVGE